MAFNFQLGKTRNTVYPLIVIWLMLAFNVWHVSKRGIWDPVSAISSLHLNEDIATTLRRYDPKLRSHRPYDGQYIYVQTFDPWLMDKEKLHLIDRPKYRYQRMLFPTIAWTFALGNPTAFPFSLILTNVMALLIGGIFAFKIADRNIWHELFVWTYIANTGLIYSTFNTLSETTSVCFAMAGIYFYSIRRLNLSGIFLAFSTLARETSLIVLLTIVLYELFVSKGNLRNATRILVLGIVPFLAWQVYLNVQIPRESIMSTSNFNDIPSFGLGRFSLPLVALWQETLYGLNHQLTTSTEAKRTLSISIYSTFLIGLGAFSIYRTPKSLWSWLCASQALFVSTLRGDIWNFHASSARQIILLSIFVAGWLCSQIQSHVHKSSK